VSKGAKYQLNNPTWDEVVDRYPLMKFSFYLQGRVNVLFDIARKIVENLDNSYDEECVNMERVMDAESLMWLWILGAYEVVRTMCQAKSCFSDKAFAELRQLKKILAVVRMPAAKMEQQGINQPVNSNRNPAGFDYEKRDLLLDDFKTQTKISARNILLECFGSAETRLDDCSA